MIYAKDTDVSVARSKAEIEDLVTRYGAKSFVAGSQPGSAVVVFECENRRIRFVLPLPDRDAFARYVKRVNQHKGGQVEYDRTPEQQGVAWEKACRQKWRALALVVKAKLEAVQSGISTFEDEFLSNIVLPNGKTLGEEIKPQLAKVYLTGRMPAMLQLGEGLHK